MVLAPGEKDHVITNINSNVNVYVNVYVNVNLDNFSGSSKTCIIKTSYITGTMENQVPKTEYWFLGSFSVPGFLGHFHFVQHNL